MKKETFIAIWFPTILAVVSIIVSSLISVYCNELKQKIESMHNSIDLVWIGKYLCILCLLLSFILYIIGYIERSIKSSIGIFPITLKEFRDEILGTQDVFKYKLLALKEFRDKEMVRVINHYNAQLNTFEMRFKALEKKLKEHNIDIDLSDSTPNEEDPNYLLHETQDNRMRNNELIGIQKGI